jgi:type VI protein secretion system component VasK
MLAEFGVGQALWTMIWFFFFIMWIMLVFRVVGDIFRSQDLSGVAKALWLIFIVFFIYLGVFVYLIARGGKMATNELRAAQAQEDAMRSYIQNAAGSSTSAAEELAKLAALKEQGVIDDSEFARLKARIVG